MKTLRILIFTIILLLFTSSSYKQEYIFVNWGSQQLLTNDPYTYTKFSAYVTRRLANEDEYHKWEYKFYLISESTINNGYNSPRPTSTWFYGLKIFLNNVEITKKSYPLGMTYAATHQPVYFYYLRSNDDLPTFSLSWLNAIYDPRGGYDE